MPRRGQLLEVQTYQEHHPVDIFCYLLLIEERHQSNYIEVEFSTTMSSGGYNNG